VVNSEDSVNESILENISDYCNSATNANKPVGYDLIPAEVSEAIAKLKWKSSCDKAAIPAKFIKNLSCVFVGPLAIPFNQILSLCVVPDAFCTSLVTPLYTGAASRNCSNSYRPISVLSVET
jgi:hypothetical protein